MTSEGKAFSTVSSIVSLSTIPPDNRILRLRIATSTENVATDGSENMALDAQLNASQHSAATLCGIVSERGTVRAPLCKRACEGKQPANRKNVCWNQSALFTQGGSYEPARKRGFPQSRPYCSCRPRRSLPPFGGRSRSGTVGVWR